MNATLKELITTMDTFNRATALTLEIQKHFSKDTSVLKKAPVKKAIAKSGVQKSTKK